MWEDVNGNGLQDTGDNGVDGVPVKLLNNANTVLGTTTTAGGGFYSSADLVPGTYKMQVVSPIGWAPTILNATAATDLTDSDINRSTGISDPVTLISNQTDPSLDGGITETVTTCDLVWVDTNGNGVRDSGDNGVAGAVLRLLDSAGTTAKYPNGTTVADVTTMSDGAYLSLGRGRTTPDRSCRRVRTASRSPPRARGSSPPPVHWHRRSATPTPMRPPVPVPRWVASPTSR